MNLNYFTLPKIQNIIKNAKFIVLDGNLTFNMFQKLTWMISESKNTEIWYEPISVEKTVRIVDINNNYKLLPGITYLSPNEMELFALLTGTKYPFFIILNIVNIW